MTATQAKTPLELELIKALKDAAIAADVRSYSREECQALIRKLGALSWEETRKIASANARDALAKADAS